MKFSGIVSSTAIAWATTFPRPTSSTKIVSATWLNANATRLTTRNRAAWPCGRLWVAANVQWRFMKKLFATATSQANADATWYSRPSPSARAA